MSKFEFEENNPKYSFIKFNEDNHFKEEILKDGKVHCVRVEAQRTDDYDKTWIAELAQLVSEVTIDDETGEAVLRDREASCRIYGGPYLDTVKKAEEFIRRCENSLPDGRSLAIKSIYYDNKPSFFFSDDILFQEEVEKAQRESEFPCDLVHIKSYLVVRTPGLSLFIDKTTKQS